jgi:predicted ABC-type ATPase
LLTQSEVATRVQEQIRQHCAAQESFSLESNLATESSYSIVDFARKSGYRIVLHFLALPNPQECGKRVSGRLQQGGHDVPFPIIEQCYKNGRLLIKQQYARFDEITFIDNSLDALRIVLQSQQGRIINQADSHIALFKSDVAASAKGNLFIAQT